MLRSGSISVPKNSVTHIFMDFLETIYSSSAVNPTFIKSSITYKTNLFGDRLQHDCPEFLNVLLDILKMEIDEFIKSQATPNGKQIDEPIEAQPNKNEDSENNSQQSIEIVPAENEVTFTFIPNHFVHYL
jgi:hypothetical protein